MKKLLCLSLAALVSTSTMAANWELVEYGELTGHSYYIDSSSIDKNGPFARAWVQSIRKKTKSSKPKDNQRSIILEEYSCSSKQYHFLSGVFYKFDGSMSADNNPTNWSYIPPGTVAETIMKRVCN